VILAQLGCSSAGASADADPAGTGKQNACDNLRRCTREASAVRRAKIGGRARRPGWPLSTRKPRSTPCPFV